MVDMAESANDRSRTDQATAPVYTGQFYLSVLEPHQTYDRDRRLFIGTVDEAMDELKEEFKTLFPDDYDRKTRDFWRQRQLELTLYVGKSTQVVGVDILGTKIVRMELYGALRPENP